MGMFRKILSLTVVALSASTLAHAEPFTILPNGDLVFNASLSTMGLFTCRSAVKCTGSGTDAITLHSRSGTATFSFTGVNTSAVIGNRTVPVTLGTFEGSATPGFSLPEGLGRYWVLFSFDFNASQSSPVAASSRVRWDFNQGFRRFGEGSPTYLSLPTGPQPPQYHYTAIYYTFRVFPLDLPLNGSRTLVADAGAVPEPTSILLVGSGLIGAILRRRKKAGA
jgi:hypothetical protein